MIGIRREDCFMEFTIGTLTSTSTKIIEIGPVPDGAGD